MDSFLWVSVGVFIHSEKAFFSPLLFRFVIIIIPGKNSLFIFRTYRFSNEKLTKFDLKLKVRYFRNVFLVSSNSPKNEFVIVVKMNSFVGFLGEFEDTKSPFEISWPLAKSYFFMCFFQMRLYDENNSRHAYST